ncbi:MAG: N-6 DNA methylase [Lachnospiraceae bacterium]|nr:N-6 DNA methylase [Lachnospiraceae bacterium]
MKKGGRMGMVLPEGVLNTANLQKVREYFEGKAKIILICSIPQDVFIAAGATVKPSLVFMKRFTEEEEKSYQKCVLKARAEIRKRYHNEIVSLEGERKLILENSVADKSENRRKMKDIDKSLKKIEMKILEEAKPLIKEYFDYEIPIAMIKDAGITTTGASSKDNQLPQLQEEYKEYRIKNKLWKTIQKSISYKMETDGRIVKMLEGKEVELVWPN